MKTNGFLLLSFLVLVFLISLPSQVQGQEGGPGCGCEMPTELAPEPLPPTPTPFATLAAPPLPPTPDKPVRPPTDDAGRSSVYLPIIGGA